MAGAATLFALLYCIQVPARPRFQLCAFHWLTARPCPLCGLTRGIFSLAKGRFAEAEHFNALTPLAFTMLFSLFWTTSWRNRLWKAGLLAFATYGILRFILE
jgi:hypothetical protein